MFKKRKYKYNPELLSYDVVQISFWKRFLMVIPIVLAVGIFALLLDVFILSKYLGTPREEKLQTELSQLVGRYKLLNAQMAKADKVLEDIAYRDNNIYRTIFEAEPISEEVRQGGFGGSNRYESLEGFDYSEVVIETQKKLDVLLSKLYVQSKSYEEVAELAKNKEDYLASVPAIQPLLRGQSRFVSGFGWRGDPVYGSLHHHDGIDLSAPRGTPIYATGKGIVVYASNNHDGYGNQVVVDHGYGFKTRYAHMYIIKSRVGQKVNRGDILGLVGSTGKSLGPHIHYEVLKGDVAVDPINYFFHDLSPEDYDKMILMSSQTGGKSLD